MQYGPDTFFLHMAGTSMSPRFEDGDFQWVDPDEREASVEVRHELRQIGVARRHVGDAAQPHLPHQPVLMRFVRPFDAPLGMSRRPHPKGGGRWERSGSRIPSIRFGVASSS